MSRNGWTPRKMATLAVTLKQHRELTENAKRPLTDRPIGGTTAQRRAIDAECSSVFRDDDSERTEALERMIAERQLQVKLCGSVEGWKAHTDRNEWPCQRCRDARRRERDA